MRGLVALVSREARDARWHLVAAFALGVAVPLATALWPLGAPPDEIVAKMGGRVVVPVVFALFAAATASELVARDVATKRIDALAMLPVPISRVWTAKALFLAATSALFLAWVVAAQLGVVAWARPGALARLPEELIAGAPYLLPGLAFGAATLFFSTLLERGMTAVLAAIVVLVAVACAVQWAAVPAAPGPASAAGWLAIPIVLTAAFVAASRAAFVRGPIHATSKLRVAVVGLCVVAAVATPAGAAIAFGVERATHLAPGEGDPALRRAFVSPDGKWVAVEDSNRAGASRTWIVGVEDGSCRLVADGATCLPPQGVWSAGSTLLVYASSFSVVDGPCRVHCVEIEPTRLGVCDEFHNGQMFWCVVRRSNAETLRDGRRVVVKDGDVMLVSADGDPIRRLFPPKER